MINYYVCQQYSICDILMCDPHLLFVSRLSPSNGDNKIANSYFTHIWTWSAPL